jgi:hypothetical protein
MIIRSFATIAPHTFAFQDQQLVRAAANPSLCANPLSGMLPLSQPPGAGESGVPPPPKAQPAPGNAQATGTAPGSGISGKPAGTPRVCRTDEVRAAQRPESFRSRDRGGSSRSARIADR